MYSRAFREVTARRQLAEGGERSETVLVHRNEWNEQQRPGALVLFPQQWTASTPPVWTPLLIRKLSAVENNDGAVECEGLLCYTGHYIKKHGLDPARRIPAALLKSNVIFVTNHVHISTGKHLTSTLTCIPVRVSASIAVAEDATKEESADNYSEAKVGLRQQRRRRRLTQPKRASQKRSHLPGLVGLPDHSTHNDLFGVIDGVNLGPGVDGDSEEGVTENDERPYFGGLLKLQFSATGRPKKARASLFPHPLRASLFPSPAAQVEQWTGCNSKNISKVSELLPATLWSEHVPSGDLVIPSACPWAAPHTKSIPRKVVTVLEGGDYDGEVISGFSTRIPGLARASSTKSQAPPTPSASPSRFHTVRGRRRSLREGCRLCAWCGQRSCGRSSRASQQQKS